MYASIDWNTCTHCGECISVCPENIFDFDYDGLMAYSNGYRCVGCNQCSDACPENAIMFEEIEND